MRLIGHNGEKGLISTGPESGDKTGGLVNMREFEGQTRESSSNEEEQQVPKVCKRRVTKKTTDRAGLDGGGKVRASDGPCPLVWTPAGKLMPFPRTGDA